MQMPFAPIEVFYSYAEADAHWLEQLERHLSVLRREGYISTWHNRQIAAGSDWQVELDRYLSTASLILLLISPDFFASDYQYGIELQCAMERHNEHEAYVIPILLRPCIWEGAPFEKLQMLPRNGRPLSKWRNRDDGFAEVAKGIQTVLQTLGSLPFSMRAHERSLWNVPYRRNPYFTGRDELFDQLDQYLARSGQTNGSESRRVALTQPHAIKGLGGIGKTQVAVEYAYRSRDLDRYMHTLWINAASEESMIASFVNIANLFPSLAAQEEKDQRKLVEAVKRWLGQCKHRWLLIFDNADEVTLVRDYLPQAGNGSILLTTRAHAVGSLAISIEVETMGFLEGTQLLLRRAQRFENASDEEINQAGNIVVALDHFPLALDQAGAYIEETQCSFTDYLEVYQNHRTALLAQRGEQVTNYPHAVATTWSLSFQKVERANRAAAELLELCSFLAPDRIPEELLRDGAAHWPPLLQQAAADVLTFQQMITELLKFSLVKRLTDDHTLSIHRLVQAVQKDRMEPKAQYQWAENVVRAVNHVFPRDPYDVALWPQCLRYLDQAQTSDMLIEQYQFSFPEASDLLYLTGIYLTEQAMYLLAAPLYQRALRIREQQLGPEHPDVAFSLNNLGLLYTAQGKYAEAEPLYQRALPILERQLGPEHLKVALVLNNLGLLYFEQSNYSEAEPLYQRALRIWEQQLVPEHPDVAFSLNNLGLLYTAQGKYAEAEPLYQRALPILERQLGPEHLKVAYPLNGLAAVYFQQGKYAEAEPLYQRALRIWEQQLVPEHPRVATSLNNLAQLYAEQGNYAEAEPLYQRALRIQEQQLVPEHPDTASSLFNLATLYAEQGKYAEAEPLYQRALPSLEQQIVPEHPQGTSLLQNLALVYAAQGKYAEAEPLYQRALPILEQYLGPDHPDLTSSLFNLATLYVKQGKYPEAEPLYQRALCICEQSLGPDHPSTQAVHRDYASLREKMEDNRKQGGWR